MKFIGRLYDKKKGAWEARINSVMLLRCLHELTMRGIIFVGKGP